MSEEPESADPAEIEIEDESLLQRVTGFLEGLGEECRGELEGDIPTAADLLRIQSLLSEGLLGLSRLNKSPTVYFQVLQVAEAKAAGFIDEKAEAAEGAVCAHLAHTLDGQPNKLELLLLLQEEIQQHINRAYAEKEKTTG